MEINRAERYCPICGKEFYIHCEPNEYGWKVDGRDKDSFYCSYSCMRMAKGEVGQKSKFGFYREVEA